LVTGLSLATLLPLLAVASGRVRSRIIAAAALVAAGGVVCTLCLPVYSAAWPERVNVEYWVDADTGQTNYLVRCDSSRLPATLAAAAHFDPAPRPRFAGGAAQAFYAAAPRLALPEPELQLDSLPSMVPGAASGRREEAWKYTSLRPVSDASFLQPVTSLAGDSTLLARLPRINAPHIVFVDGQFRPELSTLPLGVEFSRFADRGEYGKLARPDSRHWGIDAKLPRFIGSRGDNAAPLAANTRPVKCVVTCGSALIARSLRRCSMARRFRNANWRNCN
jgi:hypothetical protein